MANYFYDRYSIKRTPQRTQIGGGTTHEVSFYGGYTGWSLTSSGFTTSGTYRQVHSPYTVDDFLLGQLYFVMANGQQMKGVRPVATSGNATTTRVVEYLYGIGESQERGSYVDTISAPDGTYPVDGMSGNYWYVRQGLAFPELKIKVGSSVRTSEDGWVKVGGSLRKIDKIWVKAGGILREV